MDQAVAYSGGIAGSQFDPHLDPGTNGARWRSWIRNFNYYVDGQTGLTSKQKLARLLHQAGPSVQDIYETFDVNPEEKGDLYAVAVEKLTQYFVPKTNTVYERQVFRNIDMSAEETVQQYVIRLRNAGRYCEFTNLDEVIRDQLVQKCLHKSLVRKWIRKGSELTLEEAINMARIFELELNMEKDSVKKEKEIEKKEEETVGRIYRHKEEQKCYRCGYSGHHAKDVKKCPAYNQTCDRCNIKGHFKKQCKTKGNKDIVKKYTKKRRNIRYIIKEENSGSDDTDTICDSESESYGQEQVHSVLHINSSTQNKYDILLNNKYTLRFIVDSGACINIIDKYEYKNLVKNGLGVKKLKGCNQEYYAYGGKILPSVGTFNVTISSPETKKEVRSVDIFVYDGRGPSLLSKTTSEMLGLLRVGPEILSINIIEKDMVKIQYPQLFKGVGKLKDFKLDIPIDPKVTLVAQPIRRQPFNIREIEQRLIKELLDNDIIESVSGPTPCVSPSHIVKKKEVGQYRLVVDMRRANEAVQRERVPLPTFEELLADLNGCRYFSAIDIKWGYHQIELSEQSRVITVFSCSTGLFRYKRLFFGIRCASEMFQRIIAHLLQGIKGVANSQDDIRIGGRTRQEHDDRLRQVLDRLQENGITLNEKKCVFGVEEITFLGHHLSSNGIRPTTTNQQTIQEFRAPVNKAEVRSFLGLINFSARFIPNFSTISEPLRRLTKKDTEFVWQVTQQQAFENLKSAIVTAPVLGFYDKNADTVLVTDASPVGIAAVLVQYQAIDNHRQPIVIKYVSKALTDTEQRYSQTEKEALAIVWACENLYMYLIGKEFTIISDHKPLEVIYSVKSKPSARIQRWVLRLQSFTFKVVYKPGKSNIADPLSRLLDTSKQSGNEQGESEESLLAMIGLIKSMTLDELRGATSKDEELTTLKKAIENDIWPKELRRYELIKTELCVIDGVVLRGTRVIVPKELITRALEIGHEGHISTNGMKGKLRNKVWWRTMGKDIEYWVDTCEGCRLVRKELHPEPIKSTELPSKVWELVAIDFLGPLPSGHYLLFIVDYYSRYYEVEIMKNPTAENTIKTLVKIIAREGLMDTIVCDNGPAFIDDRFKKFLKTNDIKLRHVTPLWPQANGEVERQNRNVLRRLRIAQALKLDWKEELLTYLSAYRTTPHSTTGIPPGNLFRGRQIKTKLPEIRLQSEVMDEEMRDRDRYQKDQSKNYADKRRHAKELDLQPGDKVLIRQSKINKLTTPFSPIQHTVVWKKGNSVAAKSPDGKVVRRNSTFFQPVKDRNIKELGLYKENYKTNGRNSIEEEKETINKHKDNNIQESEKTNLRDKDMSTHDKTDKDLTLDERDITPDLELEMTRARPIRERYAPPKYKDYVLGLILNCILENSVM